MSRRATKSTLVPKTFLDASHIKWEQISTIRGILFFFRKNKGHREVLYAKLIIKTGSLIRIIFYMLRKWLLRDHSAAVIGTIEAHKNLLFE
jgi:hypothetical protein